MKKLISVLCLLSAGAAQAQKANAVADKLGVPGAVVFQNQSYNLAWTSHPTAAYYKQEYVPKGDSVERFKSMVLLEALTGNLTPKEAMAAKEAEIKKLQATNPAVRYETFTHPKTGECLIHFLVTAPAADGGIAIAEQNVYRYKTFTDGKGKKGLLLFGISKRAYGAAATAFIEGIGKSKAALVNEVAQAAVPAVTFAD